MLIRAAPRRLTFSGSSVASGAFVAGSDAARRCFPNAEFHAIANAGHWLHAEQPEAFLNGITGFMSQQLTR